MRAQFVRGEEPKDALRIGIESILWNADLEEGIQEDIVFLYDTMNQADYGLYKMLLHFIDSGDIIEETEDRVLYKTELGLMLKDEGGYGEGYFCHISSLPEIEKRLGRKIITE